MHKGLSTADAISAEEDDVSAAQKANVMPRPATHPVRSRSGQLDIAALHAAIVRRFPKVLAELAK